MKILSAFLILFIGLSVQYTTNGPCPDYPAQQNVDVTKLDGVWFELSKYENSFEKTYDCSMCKISTVGKEGKMSMCEKRYRSTYSCFTGNNTFINPATLEGKFVYNDERFPNLSFDWTLIATDYDNYMLGFSCIELPNNQVELIGNIATRHLPLNPSVQKDVDALIDKYIIKEAFFKIYQHDDYCSPRPF